MLCGERERVGGGAENSGGDPVISNSISGQCMKNLFRYLRCNQSFGRQPSNPDISEVFKFVNLMLGWLRFWREQMCYTLSFGSRNIWYGKNYYYISYNHGIKPYFSFIWIFAHVILSPKLTLNCWSNIKHYFPPLVYTTSSQHIS